MWYALARVFRHGRYASVALFVAFLAITLIALVPNVAVIELVLSLDAVSLNQRLLFVLSLYLSPFSVMSAVSVTLSFGAAVLVGINVALLLFYIRRRQGLQRDRATHAAGLGGMVSAVLGIGCAACGSAVLAGVAGIVGATGFIAALPLHGAEFGLLGVGLLLLTSWFLLRRIADPLVCPLDS